MPRIAALALALALALASLLAGCDTKKDRSPAPATAGAPAAPTSTPAPGAPPAPAADPRSSSPAPAPAPSGPELPAAETIRRLTELADKVCACPDRACVEATHAAHMQAIMGQRQGRPTPAEADQMTAQAKRFSDCLAKLP